MIGIHPLLTGRLPAHVEAIGSPEAVALVCAHRVWRTVGGGT